MPGGTTTACASARIGARAPGPRASRPWWLAAFVLVACARAPETKERSFVDDARTRSTGEAVHVALVSATYHTRSVAVRMELHDRGRGFELTPRGVLMRLAGVEMPPSPHPELPETIAVAPGETLTLTLHYPLGRPLEIGAELVVRGITRDGGAQLPVRLPLPGAPKVDAEDRLSPEERRALEAED